MIDLEKMALEAMRRVRQHVNRSAAAHKRAMQQQWRKARNDHNN